MIFFTQLPAFLQCLLRHGANTLAKDANGKIAKDLCSLEPGNACFELLSNEADPNIIEIDWLNNV